MNINCDVINDLLPLYVDEALSEASHKLVKEHIQECESCRRTFENMKEQIQLPVNQEVRMAETKSLKGLKKLVSSWKTITGIVAAVSAVAILVLSFMFMNTKTVELIYDGNNITFEQRNDGYYICYHGKGDILYSASGDRDGEWTIEFSQTLWDKYISPIYNDTAQDYWFREKGSMTKLITQDGEVIWEGTEKDKENYEQWIKENENLLEH